MMRARARGGFLLAETAVAGFLLIGAMVLIVQMLGWTASQRRAAERRGRAIQEAANAMERLTALPWDELSPENAGKIARLSPPSAGLLPDGRMNAEVTSVKIENANMKRIQLSVRWRGAGGVDEVPVRLTSWVAPREGPR